MSMETFSVGMTLHCRSRFKAFSRLHMAAPGIRSTGGGFLLLLFELGYFPVELPHHGLQGGNACVHDVQVI